LAQLVIQVLRISFCSVALYYGNSDACITKHRIDLTSTSKMGKMHHATMDNRANCKVGLTEKNHPDHGIFFGALPLSLK
jgi:hypothetical protein